MTTGSKYLTRSNTKTREMEDDMAEDNKGNGVQQGLIGVFWYVGWLFTLAFAKLIWWQALLGILIWPYYLGAALR